MFKATLFAAALAVSTLVQAQTAASAPRPATAAKQALIARVLELERASIESLGTNVVAAPVLQMRQQIGALIRQRVPEDKREAVAREIEARLAPGTMGSVLDERFSEAELKQIVAMLEAPITRKYQGMAVEFQRSMLEKVVTETRPTIEPKLRAFNDSVARRLGVSPSGAASAPGK